MSWRTARGRADAKANGVKFGRKPILTPHQQQEARKRLEARETQSLSDRGLVMPCQPLRLLEAPDAYHDAIIAHPPIRSPLPMSRRDPAKAVLMLDLPVVR